MNPRTRLRIIPGYWFPPGKEFPLQKPDYESSRAVIYSLIKKPDGSLYCLDLVWLGSWRVLSEAGALTFAHSSGLAIGEEWKFVHYNVAGPAVFLAKKNSKLTPEAIKVFFDEETYELCRPDRLIPILSLKPETQLETHSLKRNL